METSLQPDHLAVDVLLMKKSAAMLRALNHQLRLQMLRLIHAQGRMTVSEIYAQLGLEQSAASQHLSLLRKAGYVRAEREGKNIYYSLNHQRLQQVHQLMDRLVKQKS